LFIHPSEVLLDEIRDGKFIGTASHTLPTLRTMPGFLNGLHTPSPSQAFLSHPLHDISQTQNTLNGNILGTGLTVVAAPAEDFLMAAPDLHHSRTASTLLRYMSWADHVFRIEYANPIVTDGKVSPVKTRAVHIQPDATFFAKSRTISPEYDVVEFNEPADDSIWNLLF